jgi:3',5'-cyclic AMP phosphodiesterase CpdA
MRTARLSILTAIFIIMLGCLFGGAVGTVAQTVENLGDLPKNFAGQSYADMVRAVQSVQTAGKFVFVVLGDSRGNLELASKIYKQAASESPVFILHTGDMVDHGATAEYDQYHMRLVNLIAPVPLIPVPGNHEKGPNNDFAGFWAIYGADKFSFDFMSCRIVGVNNSGPDGLTEDGFRYLEQELAKPGAGNKFVIMHKPAAFMEEKRTKAGKEPKYRGFTERMELFCQLMKKERVLCVFFGHDHGFAARNMEGVRYYITGGAGAELYSDFKWLDPFHHYIVVHVDPDNVWQELVRLDGDQWIRSKLE